MSEITVKHKLLKERGKILVRSFRSVQYQNYGIRLYVKGDTDSLRVVKYELHPSFPNPVRTVRQRQGGFPLDIWTWGEFDIEVTFYHKDGTKTHTVYSLEYSDELPAEDSAYVEYKKREGSSRS